MGSRQFTPPSPLFLGANSLPRPTVSGGHSSRPHAVDIHYLSHFHPFVFPSLTDGKSWGKLASATNLLGSSTVCEIDRTSKPHIFAHKGSFLCSRDLPTDNTFLVFVPNHKFLLCFFQKNPHSLSISLERKICTLFCRLFFLCLCIFAPFAVPQL